LTLATTRSEGFTVANHRPDTRHRIRHATDADGKLTALNHEATSSTSRFDNFLMEGRDVTSALYACPNIETREFSAEVDRNTPGPMRAPPEVPYLFAMESAVDEMAIKANLDPIEWRRRNETNEDPITGKRFTSHMLMRCFDEGAQLFNWQRRSCVVGSLRQGEWLVGLGCASEGRPVKIGPVTVRIRCSGDHASVETAHHEIGNGLYTILAMAAADGLNVPVENVTVKLGDTVPAAGVSGGSATKNFANGFA
jgi:xanthine dehydrogenase YagR molybdenum-binding subunit